jgi:hypothetical protein
VQFRIATGDAGLCAREHAELVTSLGRWYVFGLKGNQPYLHDFARQHGEYDLRTPIARAAERYQGHTVVRELHARDVAGEPAAIEAAQQLWYVCQTTTDRRGEIVAVGQAATREPTCQPDGRQGGDRRGSSQLTGR